MTDSVFVRFEAAVHLRFSLQAYSECGLGRCVTVWYCWRIQLVREERAVSNCNVEE